MNSNNISKYSRKQICEALKYWKTLLKENYGISETIPTNDPDGLAEQAMMAEADDEKDDKKDDAKKSDAETDTLKQAIEIIQQQLDVIKSALGIEAGTADTDSEDDEFGDFDFGDEEDEEKEDDKKEKSKKEKKDEE